MALFSEIGLVLFIAVLMPHIYVHTFEMAVFVRIASGLAGGLPSALWACTTLCRPLSALIPGRGLYLAPGLCATRWHSSGVGHVALSDRRQRLDAAVHL